MNEYTKIKMTGYQRAGAMGEPIAEHIRFRWKIVSSGSEVDLQNVFLTQTIIGDYEELCRLDVLGLQDTPIGDQNVVYQEFLEQLKCHPDGSVMDSVGAQAILCSGHSGTHSQGVSASTNP